MIPGILYRDAPLLQYICRNVRCTEVSLFFEKVRTSRLWALTDIPASELPHTYFLFRNGYYLPGVAQVGADPSGGGGGSWHEPVGQTRQVTILSTFYVNETLVIKLEQNTQLISTISLKIKRISFCL